MVMERAVEILRTGGLVAFPMETVYGLGADATNAAAVEPILAAKVRPTTNPLIVHVADVTIARRYASAWPDAAEKLAAEFWPGPLSLVVPKATSIVDAVTAGRSTVGLRVPDHPVALGLLQAFDGTVAAPSANKSNHVSPTTAEHVRDELGEAVDLILDGGPCRVGIESTVVDLTVQPARSLRPGMVTREHIAQGIREVEVLRGNVLAGETAVSPGFHSGHYSPA